MREIVKIPLVCKNSGCEQLVGYWELFSDYEVYYKEQVKRNGVFLCLSCYEERERQKGEGDKGKITL